MPHAALATATVDAVLTHIRTMRAPGDVQIVAPPGSDVDAVLVDLVEAIGSQGCLVADGGLYHVTSIPELVAAATSNRDPDRAWTIIVPGLDVLVQEQFSPEARARMNDDLRALSRVRLIATVAAPLDAALHPVTVERLEGDRLDEAWTALNGREPSRVERATVDLLTDRRPGWVREIAAYAREAGGFQADRALAALITAERPRLRALMGSLPGQERKVLAVLAERWSPSSSAEVAEDAALAVNKASAFLHRLSARGLCRLVRTEGRCQYYELSDRLLNLFLLVERDGQGAVRLSQTLQIMALLAAGTPRRVHELMSYELMFPDPSAEAGSTSFAEEIAHAHAALVARESGVAESILWGVLSAEPAHSEATGLLSELLFGEERYDEAVALCENVLSFAPWDAMAYVRIGVARFAKGDRAGAAESLQAAMLLMPERRLLPVALTALTPWAATPEQALQALPAARVWHTPLPTLRLDLLIGMIVADLADEVRDLDPPEPLLAALDWTDARTSPLEVARVGRQLRALIEERRSA